MRPNMSPLAAAILATGCAGLLTPLEKQADFGQYFTMRLADTTEQAKLEGPRLWGSDLELTRTAEGFRGRGPSGPIDLRIEGERKIAGMVGAGSTELYLEDAGGTLTLRGRYADQLGSLEVRPDRVHGQIGRCAYDLNRPNPSSPWYAGQRSCPGAISGVELALPAALPSLPAIERGALLAVFLASEKSHPHEQAPPPRSSVGDPREAGKRPGVDMNSGRRMP